MPSLPTLTRHGCKELHKLLRKSSLYSKLSVDVCWCWLLMNSVILLYMNSHVVKRSDFKFSLSHVSRAVLTLLERGRIVPLTKPSSEKRQFNMPFMITLKWGFNTERIGPFNCEVASKSVCHVVAMNCRICMWSLSMCFTPVSINWFRFCGF